MTLVTLAELNQARQTYQRARRELVAALDAWVPYQPGDRVEVCTDVEIQQWRRATVVIAVLNGDFDVDDGCYDIWYRWEGFLCGHFQPARTWIDWETGQWATRDVRKPPAPEEITA